ncbi:MAG: hypothetical protein K0S16_21 [Moraxellaceae bacterium]|nr:hypothetical protein [Moraxellaceae bacterium]
MTGTGPARSGMHQISQEELAEFKNRRDAVATVHVLLRVLIHAGLVLAALHFLATGHHALAALFLLPHLAAFSFLGWAGIGHELFHNTVFSRRAPNQLLFRLFSVLTWSNYGYFQVSHPHHHRLTLAPQDPEGLRPPPLGAFTLLQLFTVDVASLYRRVRVLMLNAFGKVPETGIGGALFPRGSAARAQLCAGARIVLGSQLALLAVFVATGAWWMILIVTLAPFCLTFFNRTLAVAQHFGLQDSGRNYADSCRTVLLDPVTAFFYANMNYHVEHHYFPNVPYYNLDRLHRLLASRIPLPHLERGYLATLRELARQGLFLRARTSHVADPK